MRDIPVQAAAVLLFLCSFCMAAAGTAEVRLDPRGERAGWLDAMTVYSLADLVEDQGAETCWHELADRFPLHMDWLEQDARKEKATYPILPDAREIRTLTARVLEECENAAALKSRLADVRIESAAIAKRRALDLYSRACQLRRGHRLAHLVAQWPRIVFTRHYNLGGSHYAYTENLSDAAYIERQNHNSDYRMGASLSMLEVSEDGSCRIETLLEDSGGVIRDPDVSFDGRRILFAWRKSPDEDDYHLYEMDFARRKVRQLTHGVGHADYEGIYLPDGDMLFNSTRCVQIVDCWWTDVSNLYRCDSDGNLIRRISFDQVHTNYPMLLEDGRVIYTRWDYNDRGQIYPQPLFQMNPDGTNQRAYYGGNSWFPTAIMHARGVPGSTLVMAVLSGHHSHQRGKLALIDVRRGREEAGGAQLIAPVRETAPHRIDAYGQDGDQFQYPYPMNASEFLVTYTPYGAGNRNYKRPYGIYFMDSDGNRELIAADPKISCNQPVPLAARLKPRPRPAQTDYSKDTGVYYIQDVYVGPGLQGVPRGIIKKIRVAALEYRPAGIRSNRNSGPAGGALISTPAAIGNGSWDVKIILGHADVYPDGSACFEVPARTPVYFQAIDDKGHAVQTMRSWSTLQPGERLSCVGCHESPDTAPPRQGGMTEALRRGPRPLAPFYGLPRGFSFAREVQPILDRHCIRCHDRRPGEEPDPDAEKQAFSLRGDTTAEEKSGRAWSDAYLALTDAHLDDRGFLKGRAGKYITWISAQSEPSMLPPYHAGAAKSPLTALLEKGHHGVALSREEKEKIAAWIDLLVPYCGSYTEARIWTEAEHEKYRRALEKRAAMEERERQSIAVLLQKKKAVP
jgi:hypothetical protein